MLPGTWVAENGEILVTNPDGSVDRLETNWYRQEVNIEDYVAKVQQAKELKEHLAEKRKIKEALNGRGR